MTAQAHTSLSISGLALFATYVADHAVGALQVFSVLVSATAGVLSIAYTLHKWRKEQ